MSQRKISQNFFITAECCLQHLTIECRLYDSTFHTYQQIFREQYPWKKDCLWHWGKSGML